jgi:hypothetical protein
VSELSHFLNSAANPKDLPFVAGRAACAADCADAKADAMMRS